MSTKTRDSRIRRTSEQRNLVNRVGEKDAFIVEKLKMQFPRKAELAWREENGKRKIPQIYSGLEKTDRKDLFDPKYGRCVFPVKDADGYYNNRCTFDMNDFRESNLKVSAGDNDETKASKKKLQAEFDQFKKDFEDESVRVGIYEADYSFKQFIAMRHAATHWNWYFDECFTTKMIDGVPVKRPPNNTEIIPQVVGLEWKTGR